MPGVYSTAVGYAGGFTPNPSYEEACSGMTGHTEGVKVVYDPEKVVTCALPMHCVYYGCLCVCVCVFVCVFVCV